MSNHLKVIAIDGPAASGKSTTAREVAKRLGWRYIDTGAMYRALALAALRAGVDPQDSAAVQPIVENARVELSLNEPLQVFLNGEDVNEAIRSPELSEAASRISVHTEVRRRLVQLQRRLGKSAPSVLEGRDTGTVVFPDAGLKVYLKAGLEERVHRRMKDYNSKGMSVNHDNVRSELIRRDERDSNRKDSPLSIAEDAFVIDTTALNIDRQVEEVLKMAGKRFLLR